MLTILRHFLARSFWTHVRQKALYQFVRVRAFWLSDWWSSPMPELDKVQPVQDLLFALTSTIVVAFALGMPMAVAIIWICS